ncbi:DUF2184 domain-containing protein [Lichenifustis flavocetrariae]|uniref:DUF2184 domain-containing protein n=1 Tax=Lichenifustis flavocetrariae TaxID=2949735 RepID=A0AA41YYM1_9HYPH|nr:DUF2184 domain-containing protein [Lichenifustis flavocetrariae]MCW6510979.1 DUF2184 domain-containing protein [Lichenifustis flavocetrariae]
MLRTAASFDAQATLGFLVSQTSSIEQEVYAIRYADIQYPNLVPVDTSAYPWARTVTYFTVDQAGQADWMNGNASDMPFAEIAHTKYETTVEAAKIGYRYSLEEVNQAMMIPGMNLTADKAAAARRAAEELVERVVLSGDTRKGFLGLVNQTSVPQAAVPNGAASSPLWSSKTPGEILADVNNSIVGAWSATQQIELHDTVLLPIAQYGLIAGTPRSTNADTTILSYLQANNIYTATTGQPLTIRTLRQLTGAGAGGTNRMITYRRDPQVLKFHMPMPHQFFPPQQRMLEFIIPGMMRLGGLDVRLPKGISYNDGI